MSYWWTPSHPGAGPPTVTLRGNDASQLGLLARDASPEQIDATIRGVAAGLVVRSAEVQRPAFEGFREPGARPIEAA
jgi:hypothetical protein